VGALGLTEPGAGSDALGSMRTTARRDGDHYVLNGAKMYITNGAVADVILVYAKTAPEKGPHGISAFIVEKDFPGFKVAQKLAEWPRLVEIAARTHEPHRIAFYLYELASEFHALWNKGNDHPELRFLAESDSQATAAKIALPKAVSVVISAGLGILGVTPLEEMR
jgi:hypothetical protein